MIISGLFLHIAIFAGFFRPVSQYMRTSEKADESRDDKQSFCGQLRGKLANFSILRDKRLQLLLVAAVCLAISLFPAYSHTPNRAYFYGVDKHLASVLPSITGLTTFVSRICSSFVADLKHVNRMLMYGAGILAFGLSLCFYTFAKSFTSIAIFCGIFGLEIGQYAIQKSGCFIK